MWNNLWKQASLWEKYPLQIIYLCKKKKGEFYGFILHGSNSIYSLVSPL